MKKAWNADIRCNLHHDNVRSCTASSGRALLEHFNWELFDLPPYSRELAQSDYYLLTYLKKQMVELPAFQV
jgi:hypothetical protein